MTPKQSPFPKGKRCPECMGDGRNYPAVKCTGCDGKGYVIPGDIAWAAAVKAGPK